MFLLLDQGFNAFFQGSYVLAKEAFEAIVSDDNQYRYCQWYLGLSLFHLEQYELAKQIWLEALTESSDISTVEEFIFVLEVEATWQETKFNYIAAFQIREVIAEEFPENVDNLLRMLRLALLLGMKDAIIDNLLLLLSESNLPCAQVVIGDLFAEILADLLDRYGQRQQSQDFLCFSQRYLEHQLISSGDRVSYLISLSQVYQAMGSYDRAEECLQELLDRFPDNERLGLQALNLYLLTESSQDLENFCEKLLGNNQYSLGTHIEVYSLMILNYFADLGIESFNELEAMVSNLEDSMKLLIESSQEYISLAHKLRLQNQVLESWKYYNKLTSLKSVYVKGWQALGKYYISQNNPEQASRCFSHLLAVCKQGVEALEIESMSCSEDEVEKQYEYYSRLLSFKFFHKEYFNAFSLVLTKRSRNQPDIIANFTIDFAKFCREEDKIFANCLCFTSLLAAGRPQESYYYFQKMNHFLQDREKVRRIYFEFLYYRIVFFIPHLVDNLAYFSNLLAFITDRLVQLVFVPKFHFSNIPVPKFSVNQSWKHSSLRLGFFSPHFIRHPVGFLCVDVINALANYSDVFVYPTNVSKQKSDLPFGFNSQVAICQDKIALPGDLIDQVEKDEIDVLIDLDSYTETLPPQALFARPAPVCISWLGFDAPYISKANYFLCDRYTHPEGVDRFYIEQLIRMPHSHMCVARFEVTMSDRDAVRKSLGISNDQIVFYYSAAGRKFNRETASAQVQILKHVPNSVLLRKKQPGNDFPREVYDEECSKLDVDRNRIISIVPTATEEEHRFYYYVADVSLDSYPYNGGSQNLEALWCELPLVTYRGEQSFARMGYSLLTTLGITEGVADCWETYIDWGVQFGTDQELRLSIKDRLVKSKEPDNLSPLWNPDRFARDMLAILQDLYTKVIGSGNIE